MKAPSTPTILVALLMSSGSVSADPLLEAVSASCRPDGRLLPAAQRSLDDDPWTAEDLRALVREAGLPAPSVRSIVVSTYDHSSALTSIARFFATGAVSAIAPRCAVARDASRLSIAEAPASLDQGRGPFASLSFIQHPALPFGATDPHCVGINGEGRTEELSCSLAWDSGMPLAQASIHTLQLIATVRGSPVPLALWRSRPVAATEAEAPGDLRGLLAAINRLRESLGIRGLRGDPLLARAAQDHAEYLHREGRVSHLGVEGGLPPERLARRSIYAQAYAENVGRAPTLATAHARLLRSPSHRANMLHPAVDAAGFGLAGDATGVTLVEMFAREPALAEGQP